MHPSRGVYLAACVALALTGTACNSSDNKDDPGENRTARLYGADGNMSNSFGDEFKEKPGLLAGMKGTAPLTQLAEGFKTRLKAVDSDLEDFSYSAETYDAVMISAIASELAGTTDPRQIAKYVNGVTAAGEPCDTAADCLDMARDGKDLRYHGVSLRRGGFTDAGEPAAASYATLHFSRTDKLDDGKTEFVGAGDESTTTKEPPPAPRKAGGKSGAPLVIGGLLPQTGSLSHLLPPMQAGAYLAINEINAAGGILGKDVKWINGDDGTDPKVARKTIDTHVEAGVHVIIGAGASGVSRAVLPDVVRAGLLMFSPSNTAADLSTADDQGLYFRTAPPDTLQGKALADVILRDGVQKVAIVARDDSYGTGLQDSVKTELDGGGLTGDEVKTFLYPSDEKAKPDFAALAKEIKSFQADGVLIIGFAESADLIKALDAAGISLRH